MENSVEKDIKIIEDFILKTDVDYSEYNEQIIGDISYQAIQHLLSAYKRVLKENKEWERAYQEEKEEQFDLIKENYKLKNELENKRKEYQETYKDVREELKELRKDNEELKKDISNMYDEEVIISIISDNFNLSRNEVLELLGGEE